MIEYISLLPSGYLEKIIGPRFTTLLGLILTVVHYIILYFATNYWIGLLAMGIFGCGIGLGYFPLITCSWKYFPAKKGILSGVILCCFGMGSFIWTFIAESLINPDGDKVQSEGDYKNYYSPESKACTYITKFWLLMFFISIGFTVIVGLLSFDYYEDEQTEKSSDLIESDESKKENEEKKVDTKLIIRIFFSWDFSRVVIMQVGCLIFIYLVSVTMRPFGESIKKLPIEPLKVLSLTNSILNGISRIIWGFVIDFFGIKKCLIIDIIILIISSATYYFFGGNIVLYFIINIITTIANSGNSVLMPMVNKQINGEYFVILLGYAGLYFGLSSWIGPFFVKVLDIKERGEIVYLITYLICCGFCVNSLVLACFIGDKPIDYDKFRKVSEKTTSKTNLELKETSENQLMED